MCLGLPGAFAGPQRRRGAARRPRGARPRLFPRADAQRLRAARTTGYPDLPKGYQISQFELPLSSGGTLSYLSPDRGLATATIGRLHLEEDAGRSLHDKFPHQTAVDINRCGVPLIEIVTGPDFRSPQEARAYLLTLKQVLEYVGVSDCDMEKGSLRVDANVSVRRVGAAELGTKTEVKNINSFAYVEKALGVERDRQIALIESGGTVVQQTMLYDSKTKTASGPSDGKRRVTTTATSQIRTSRRSSSRPSSSPSSRRCSLEATRAQARTLRGAVCPGDLADAAVLTAERAVADYYEAVVHAGAEPKAAANWVMGEVLGDAKDHGEALRVPAAGLAQLIALVKGGTLSHQAAKRSLRRLVGGVHMTNAMSCAGPPQAYFAHDG